jgi:uncharacterized protein
VPLAGCGIGDVGRTRISRGHSLGRRIYWPDYRLSEDLDFTSERPVANLETRLSEVVQIAKDRTTLDLVLKYGAPQRGWSRSTIEWADRGLLLDVNSDVEVALGASREKIDLPYQDLRDIDANVSVFSLAEILGNKWYMLNDRREPRDLFDVWCGLIRFGVPFEEIERGHRARYGYGPSSGSLDNAKRLEEPWDVRLGHQVADLPPFRQVYRDVKREFERWYEKRSDQ